MTVTTASQCENNLADVAQIKCVLSRLIWSVSCPPTPTAIPVGISVIVWADSMTDASAFSPTRGVCYHLQRRQVLCVISLSSENNHSRVSPLYSHNSLFECVHRQSIFLQILTVSLFLIIWKPVFALNNTQFTHTSQHTFDGLITGFLFVAISSQSTLNICHCELYI
ncbi:MAG: hypothetical protein J07HQW2_00177 [Haloquadratum walsbyi J07HQW2]|uniref:Uncharacterized protein n=1 Tax=Haloquadratum walsbyi J07HQW2 TaxID=1238425 RepID=U1NAU8_9EURY|nr:MAG: hypothetical protein J07HQW2_00177 [Haloquadratum walsbyi J07HQW2]